MNAIEPLEHLDLFSGLGGFALAAKELGGINTTQFVEIEPACRRRLNKNFPGVPIHDDVTTFTPDRAYGIVTAGYPCQDISPASNTRTGLQGDRSGLFYECIRLLRSIRPDYLILENSSALLTHRGGRDMATILWELSESGYDAQWSIVSACAVGAPHMRERLFILAYPHSFDVEGVAFQQEYKKSLQRINDQPRPSLWATSTPPARVVDGIPSRMERMKMIGNAVVPEVARVSLAIALAMHQAREAVKSWAMIQA
jgi:DNA (cytosine-5)-methyltransferase 1